MASSGICRRTLAYVWPSSTYFTAPSAAVPFRNRGGVVTRWQPKTASREGVPHVELAAASGAAAHGCGRRVKDTAN